MECRLCIGPLTDEPHRKCEHPKQRGNFCTGFRAHTTCLAHYLNSHRVEHTNYVCMICNVQLPVPATMPILNAAMHVVDAFYLFGAGINVLSILITGPDRIAIFTLGTVTLYAGLRYRRGGTRKRRLKGGMTMEEFNHYTLKPDEFAILTITDQAEIDRVIPLLEKANINIKMN